MTVKGIITLGVNEGIHNSPWNIVTDFKVDMAFSPADIATMLCSYEADHHTGMDIAAIASKRIFDIIV